MSPTGGRIRLERRCLVCGSDGHGKPVLVDYRDLHVSLSYQDDLVLVGLTTAGEVGVDIEAAAATDFAGFDSVTLAPAERPALQDLTGPELLHARARMWARKEAVLKATGHGLVLDPCQLLLSAPTEPARLRRWSAEQPGPPAITVADLEVPGVAHAAAVAVLATGPLTVDYA